jgi:hypothetical protein
MKTTSELFEAYSNRQLEEDDQHLLDEKLKQNDELRILFRIYRDLEVALQREGEMKIRKILAGLKRTAENPQM